MENPSNTLQSSNNYPDLDNPGSGDDILSKSIKYEEFRNGIPEKNSENTTSNYEDAREMTDDCDKSEKTSNNCTQIQITEQRSISKYLYDLIDYLVKNRNVINYSFLYACAYYCYHRVSPKGFFTNLGCWVSMTYHPGLFIIGAIATNWEKLKLPK